MNNKLRRKLIWKYFWKRKREEVWGFVKNFWPILLIILWVISLIVIIQYPEDSIIFIIGIWIAAAPIFLLWIGGIGFGIYFVSKKIIQWLRQNWEWATEDADIELRRMRRK